MNPFIWLIAEVIDIYVLVVIVWAVLSMLISFRIVDRNHPFVYKVNDVLTRLVEPALRPIRRFLPDINGVDLSPLVLILLLHFLKRLVFYVTYSL